MEKESQSVVQMGLEAILGAFLLFGAIVLLLFGKSWYSDEANKKNIQEDISVTATTYTMFDRELVSGSDIVEFIIKHGSIYDYYIQTYNIEMEITKTRAKNETESNGNGWKIWTERYLIENVFANTLSEDFTVTVLRDINGELYGFVFAVKTE